MKGASGRTNRSFFTKERKERAWPILPEASARNRRRLSAGAKIANDRGVGDGGVRGGLFVATIAGENTPRQERGQVAEACAAP